MNGMVVLISILLVVSKFFDCWTTSIQITHIRQERNPMARIIFRKFGIQTSIWGIFGLSVVLISLGLWLLFEYYDYTFYKIIYIIIGVMISAIQFAVAHTNKTKKTNLITRILLHKYKNT